MLQKSFLTMGTNCSCKIKFENFPIERMDFIMKKIATLCLSVVMLLSLSLTVFAAPGVFVSSPSSKPAPELVAFINMSEDCVAQLKLGSYAERHTLDEATRKQLEEAYDQIVNSLGDNDFSRILEKLAKENDMLVSGLSVSDLFDISAYGCDDHEGHEGFTITIKAETIDGVIGLLHMNGDIWEIVSVSNIDEANNTMTFYVENLSPFAIVVDNGSGSLPPETRDTSMIYIWTMIISASGVLLILVCSKSKKHKV